MANTCTPAPRLNSPDIYQKRMQLIHAQNEYRRVVMETQCACTHALFAECREDNPSERMCLYCGFAETGNSFQVLTTGDSFLSPPGIAVRHLFSLRTGFRLSDPEDKSLLRTKCTTLPELIRRAYELSATASGV